MIYEPRAHSRSRETTTQQAPPSTTTRPPPYYLAVHCHPASGCVDTGRAPIASTCAVVRPPCMPRGSISHLKASQVKPSRAELSQAESRQAYSSQTCPTAVQLRSLYRAPCSLLPAELPARVLASSPSSPVQSSHVGAPCPSDRILPLALSPVPPTLHTALLTVPAVTRLADRP